MKILTAQEDERVCLCVTAAATVANVDQRRLKMTLVQNASVVGGATTSNPASTEPLRSTRLMSKVEIFSSILSNNASLNLDFYNWNRVKLRYCDGASFGGDAVFDNGTSLLYFRGQRIWQAIILDLLPKGLGQAKKALLSGSSAGLFLDA
ncbi:hypothetical protein SASPL_116120 [Salvia splendens]|uniref:Pectin acetylesterase n=1 Tax=Salvia splendens TaxID=180675 RepID=A0A8X8Y8W9_SALSN|nr:hypothetical protein SASPL_116120 [Salvia splendens]